MAYVMVAVPFAIPFTTPVDELTVAIAVLPLLQLPLSVRSLSVVVLPAHTRLVPVMPAGCVFTVYVLTEEQVPRIYDMVAVPADMPVTTPDVFTVAISALPLLHVPLAVASLSVVVAPAHTVLVPVILTGCVFTV